VILSPNPNFVAGLEALFASLYIFNLEYQEGASCTLEYQRCFAEINPVPGFKISSEKVIS
ncbi:hypothetical protein NFI96_022139, partial [Prochilodus magdalenae]